MSTAPYVVEDCRGLLQLLSDGTTIRSSKPLTSAFPEIPSVEWKDAVYNTTHNLHVRMYKPKTPPTNAMLPVLVHFHGGGFCLGSRAWPSVHQCCLRLASGVNAIVVSADYRLAPEHRLPAAIEDAADTLEWLRDQLVGPTPCPWLAETADVTRVFVTGVSAGGNLAHHMAVRFGPRGLNPVHIAGSVLIMPAFVGTTPTRSERECPPDAYLNKEMYDRYGRLAMPLGADMDHWTLNPFGPESRKLDEVDVGEMLVVVAERDILRDRSVDYVRRMREMGKNVDIVEVADEEHGFFAVKVQSEVVDQLIGVVKRFVDMAGQDS